MLNDLRSRITVEADGQLKTGRDVVIAGLLGADEIGFSTAPLIAMGCIMMRVCHLNTCPVGIATQDPGLRKRFEGTPEHVVNYLFFVAEEARELMARLGVRTFDELIGRADLLEMDAAIEHWKARGVDLTGVFAMPEVADGAPRTAARRPEPVLDDALDWELVRAGRAGARARRAGAAATRVRNVNRTVGGAAVERDRPPPRAEGLPEGTIEVALDGSAGQSFGAWLMPGVTFTLAGEANDYTGKGLAGGVLAVRPPEDAGFAAEENVIVGNTVLYGATGGRAFFRGLAGERFAVRNSGANAVVEGVGDHGCEYMTGGRVVVLGPTGRNFAAGMSGGIAYVYDERRHVRRPLQPELVDLEPLERARRGGAEGPDRRARRAHRLAGRRADARRLGRAVRRFVKVMPRDYKRALAERAAARPPPRTARPASPSPGRSGALSHGTTGRLPQDPRVGFDKRDPGQRVSDYERVLRPPAARRSCADRARAAWTAASRSATRAARSAT